jgi:hypothetical protein
MKRRPLDLLMLCAGVWSTYLVNSTTHTYVIGPGLYTTSVAGTKLTDWIDGIVTGAPSAHVGPRGEGARPRRSTRVVAPPSRPLPVEDLP